MAAATEMAAAHSTEMAAATKMTAAHSAEMTATEMAASHVSKRSLPK